MPSRLFGKVKIHKKFWVMDYVSLVYFKQSNTGHTLNYHTSCPKFWKSGLLLMWLLHKAKLIGLNVLPFNNEIRGLSRISAGLSWVEVHTLNYHASGPKFWKFGPILMCLLHRVKLIGSNVLPFNNEVRSLGRISAG